MFTGEVSEPVKKKRKTMNTAMEEGGEEQDEGEREEEGNAEMYQHIKEAKKKFDTQTMDAATEVSYCVWLVSSIQKPAQYEADHYIHTLM